MATTGVERRVGRPPKTDRGTLLLAAREIGFQNLTVGAVTMRVGVKYSTFYRHFPSLDALVADYVDSVLDQAPLPDAARSWRAHLLGTAATLSDVLSRNPGMAWVVARLPEAPRRLRDAYWHAVDVLLQAGFRLEDATLGADSVITVAIAPWVAEPIDAGGPPIGGSAPSEIPTRWMSSDPVAARPSAGGTVELIIDGLETRLQQIEQTPA